MAEDQKNTQKEFQKFCEGMDFPNMMRKFMEGKQEGKPFDCAEMMGKMMAGKEGAPFNCSEIMAKMMGRATKEEKA